ncbi:ROK family transcriptional regulator [Paenibacillus eucommiae]|uniref:NBD/HSP70 family sugar kinase n=1 Tax=Paenibacillus eucommiae TaxID=1355755 RepID=A0ABS4J698_9BACL|nr:ROK family transcriptional regulator [Paenibacillus eucommiae]MBP1995360.1 putative NBD/HSP70 family sugar kinase [Paenibacillus eucommiae]
MIKIGNQQMLREINKSTLLHTIFDNGPISRVDLSRKTKLSPTTVSILIDDMIRQELVHEIGTTGSGVGRKMTLLNIKADGGYVLGIDLASSPAHCVLLNLHGELIANQGLKSLVGEEQLRSDLVSLTHSFIEKQNIPQSLIRRVGISVPGRLDDKQSVVITSHYLKLHNFPLLSVMEEALSIPVLVTNDLDAAGFAERFSGAAKGDHTTVFIMIDYGTGAGIVLNGQVYHGARGTAGKTEYFEPYCTQVLAGKLKEDFPGQFEALSADETIRTFIELGLSGIEPYRERAEYMIADIANYCARTLQMLNPQKMILGGWITENGLFFDKLVTAINKKENSPYGATPVVSSHWKKYGAAMGAATLGLYEIFKQKVVQ